MVDSENGEKPQRPLDVLGDSIIPPLSQSTIDAYRRLFQSGLKPRIEMTEFEKERLQDPGCHIKITITRETRRPWLESDAAKGFVREQPKK